MDAKDWLQDFQILLNPAFLVRDNDLTAAEHSLLVEIFNQPVVKKYLEVLIANKIIEFANIPLNVLAEDGDRATLIKQAFFKGGLSMLLTLLDVRKPQPNSVQATQGQNQR